MASRGNGSNLRRGQDFPVLLVSQDYELFFQQSGSIDKCLFEPTNMLLDFAEQFGVRITFFIDAGMLCRMQKLALANASMANDLSRIQRHIESLHVRGHEIGLHIHPHWEDTKWTGDAWEFSGTRYQLRDFSADKVSDIVSRYTTALNELCDGTVKVFRAGGFCVEPFDLLKTPLLENGISIDSSIVPGARLKDADKGFDFTSVPNKSWWHFEESPLRSRSDGRFLEIPITTAILPFFHYWGRAVDRALKRQPLGVIGDGSSKAIGTREIVRRLAGVGRVSELSLDAAKARQLVSNRVLRQDRKIWQVMGHPKLLSKSSLESLQKFVDWKKISRFETLSGIAAAIYAGDVSDRPN